MMTWRGWVAGICSAGALACGAGPAVRAQEPRTYQCRFETGAAHIYGKGAFKPESAAPLTFAVAEIDAAKQTAVQKSAKGEGPLRVVRAVGALHFLEVVSEGYLNITTIYDKDTAKGEHPAVHSRHFGVLGEPIVSQYTGSCKGQ